MCILILQIYKKTIQFIGWPLYHILLFLLRISNDDLFLGKDVLAKARTGTGKTVAFLVNSFGFSFQFLYNYDSDFKK